MAIYLVFIGLIMFIAAAAIVLAPKAGEAPPAEASRSGSDNVSHD